tara:strand:- start:618 stop:950 length:333 start_codon:yes stop_codon:yes gene_type:complete
MKKITLSVAALSIAMMSYGQTKCNYKCGYEQDELGNTIHQSQCDLSEYKNNVKKFKEIEYRLMDLVDAIKMDMYYGRIQQQNAEYYLNQVASLMIENKLLMASIYKNETK